MTPETTSTFTTCNSNTNTDYYTPMGYTNFVLRRIPNFQKPMLAALFAPAVKYYQIMESINKYIFRLHWQYIIFKEPAEIFKKRNVFWSKIIRCNRKGIGLRLKNKP